MSETLKRRVMMRLILTVAFLVITVTILRQFTDEEPPRRSDNIDAQLVYLLAEVDEEGWTQENRTAYITLLEQQGKTELISRFVGGENISQASVQSLRLLIEEEIAGGNWEQVNDYAQRLLALDSDDAFANYHYGLLLLTALPDQSVYYLNRAGVQYSSSAQRIAAMVSSNSDSGALYRSAGSVLAEVGEWEHAERLFTAAIEVDNLDWFSYAYRGYVRDEQGKDGLEDFEMARAIAPAERLPYYFLGLYWRRAPHIDYEAAHDAFSKAYQLDPTGPEVAVEIALTYQLQGQYEHTSEWFSIARGLDPLNVEWARMEASFYADNSYFLEDGGLEMIETAVTVSPDDPHLLTSLGRAYFLVNRIPEARFQLNRAKRSAPDDPRNNFYLGEVLREQGDIDGARAAYRDVIRVLGSDTGYGVFADRALSTLQ
ncbi:MAG: tetratricopeptide repeat protein [Chloroflexi bacterium]|nr:tetratricopeptide repeat protein [Chloroflexota bacterium]